MEYSIVTPPFFEKFKLMNADEAQLRYVQFISEITTRISILEGVLRSDDNVIFHNWRADKTPESLELLGGWLYQNLRIRPRTEAEITHIMEGIPEKFRTEKYPIETSTLDEKTLSLTYDAGIYFGEVLRCQFPQLRWQLLEKPRTSVDYQRPVLVGGFGKIHHVNPLDVLLKAAMLFAAKKQEDRYVKETYNVISGYVQFIEMK